MARAVAEQVFIPFTIGGGIRTIDDARRLLMAGADKVSVNTAAVKRPELIQEISREFGARKCRRHRCPVSDETASGFEVFTHGGRTRTGLDAVVWGREVVRLGAGEILLTSMDRTDHGRFDLTHLGAFGRGGCDRIGVSEPSTTLLKGSPPEEPMPCSQRAFSTSASTPLPRPSWPCSRQGDGPPARRLIGDSLSDGGPDLSESTPEEVVSGIDGDHVGRNPPGDFVGEIETGSELVVRCGNHGLGARIGRRRDSGTPRAPAQQPPTS